MSRLTSFPVEVLTIASVLGLAAWACPERTADLERELGNLPGLVDQLTAERRRGTDLDLKASIVLDRLAGRKEIVNKLIAGQLTLAQAAGQFGMLNTSPPDWPTPSSVLSDGKTPDEQLCRQVIAWTIHELNATSPELVATVASRLEAEFQQFRQSAGIRQSH